MPVEERALLGPMLLLILTLFGQYQRAISQFFKNLKEHVQDPLITAKLTFIFTVAKPGLLLILTTFQTGQPMILLMAKEGLDAFLYEQVGERQKYAELWQRNVYTIPWPIINGTGSRTLPLYELI